MAGGDATVTTDLTSDDRLWRRSWPTGSSVMGVRRPEGVGVGKGGEERREGSVSGR